MRPTPGDVHINRALTNLSIGIFQSMTGFVADQVFPVVPSDFQGDSYYEFDETYFNRDVMKKRAPGARAEVIKWDLGNKSFFCDVWAAGHPIPDQVRRNSDSPIDQDMAANELVIRVAKTRMEKLWVANFFQSGIWTSYDYTGVPSGAGASQFVQWSVTNSTPVEDVAAAGLSMLSRTGLRPNTLVVGAQVDNVLRNHAEIVSRVIYGGTPGAPAIVDTSALAKLFNVDRYLVMDSIEETAVEGATSSPAFIGGKKALLVYAAPRPGLMIPSAGYTFSWTGLLGATANGYRIKKYRMEPEESDMVEIQLAIDPKLTSAKLGAFFNTAVA